MISFLARWVLKYPKRIALLGTLLGVVSAYFSALLYMNLRPDIEELLPSTARSVKDLDQLTERLGSFENMVILTFSNDKQLEDYIKRMEAIPTYLEQVMNNMLGGAAEGRTPPKVIMGSRFCPLRGLRGWLPAGPWQASHCLSAIGPFWLPRLPCTLWKMPVAGLRESASWHLRQVSAPLGEYLP